MTDSELLKAIEAMIQKENEPLKQRFDSMEQRFDSMEQRFDSMEQRFDSMEQRFDSLEQEVKSMKLTLENETNRNIQLIAEGHAILNRRLDEALKINSENELLHVRVNVLENELRKVKEKLESIA